MAQETSHVLRFPLLFQCLDSDKLDDLFESLGRKIGVISFWMRFSWRVSLVSWVVSWLLRWNFPFKVPKSSLLTLFGCRISQISPRFPPWEDCVQTPNSDDENTGPVWLGPCLVRPNQVFWQKIPPSCDLGVLQYLVVRRSNVHWNSQVGNSSPTQLFLIHGSIVKNQGWCIFWVGKTMGKLRWMTQKRGWLWMFD